MLNTTVDKCIVYRHVRQDKNEVFYIGIGKRQSRAYSQHGRNQHWLNIVKSNPNYRIDILFEDVSFDFAKEKEIELIKFYGRKDLGLGTLVNLTDGGDGGNTSEESKLKISKFLTGKKRSKEFGEKVSRSLTGRKLSMLQRQNMSISKLGRKMTPKHIENAAKARGKGELYIFKDNQLFKQFDTINKARKELNISNLHKIITGERLNKTGYTFKIT